MIFELYMYDIPMIFVSEIFGDPSSPSPSRSGSRFLLELVFVQPFYMIFVSEIFGDPNSPCSSQSGSRFFSLHLVPDHFFLLLDRLSSHAHPF